MDKIDTAIPTWNKKGFGFWCTTLKLYWVMELCQATNDISGKPIYKPGEACIFSFRTESAMK